MYTSDLRLNYKHVVHMIDLPRAMTGLGCCSKVAKP